MYRIVFAVNYILYMTQMMCRGDQVKGRLGILEWRRHFTRNRVERSYKLKFCSATNHQAADQHSIKVSTVNRIEER